MLFYNCSNSCVNFICSFRTNNFESWPWYCFILLGSTLCNYWAIIGHLLCSCAIIVHQPWLPVREHVWLFFYGENATRKLLEMWNLKLHRMNGNDRVLWWPCRQFMQYWNFDMLGILGQALALEQISLKVKFIPPQAWNLHSPKITVLRVPGLVFSIWRIPSFSAISGSCVPCYWPVTCLFIAGSQSCKCIASSQGTYAVLRKYLQILNKVPWIISAP